MRGSSTRETHLNIFLPIFEELSTLCQDGCERGRRHEHHGGDGARGGDQAQRPQKKIKKQVWTKNWETNLENPQYLFPPKNINSDPVSSIKSMMLEKPLSAS